MRCVLRALGALSIVGAVAVAAPAGALAVTDPAPPATPALAYTLKSKNSSMWTMSADGGKLAISTSVTNKRTNVDVGTIELVDLRSGKSTVFKVPDAQYLPPDPSLSADGRFLSWTTATSKKGPKKADGLRKGKRSTRIWDPTTWVRDLTTGAVRKFSHYDGNFDDGDGSFLLVSRGGITRWGAPGNSPEVPASSGILFLSTGKFVKLPGGGSTPNTTPVFGGVTPDGSALGFVADGKCRVLATATGAVATLGACTVNSYVSLSDDGKTAFSDDLGGWVDVATGAKLGAPLDTAITNLERGRSSVDGPATGDLSKIVVVCNPGLDPDVFEQEFTLPRRTYLLDRTTRLYAPLAGPTSPIATPGAFMTGLIRTTAAGDELFWGDGKKIWRESMAPTGPAAPLPADCQPG